LCLRRAYLRQLRAVGRTKPRWWAARGPVGADPVLWREHSIEGIAPLPFLRACPCWLGVCGVLLASAGLLGWLLSLHLPPGTSMLPLLRTGRWAELGAALRMAPGIDDVFYWHGLAGLVAATFVVAIRASGCISGERERDTWQAVMLTPLPIRKIIRGKYWGIVLAFLPYLVAYTVAALLWGVLVGVVALAWTLTWLVAALFAVQYAGATGIWRSAQGKNSWLSLAATLAWCYASWALAAVPIAILLWIVHGAVTLVLSLDDLPGGVTEILQAVQGRSPGWLAVALALIPAWFLWRGTLEAAVRAIAVRDRAKDIDPQFQHFYDRWMQTIEEKRRRPPPPTPVEFEEPLALQD
jgi:hypothetical protein